MFNDCNRRQFSFGRQMGWEAAFFRRLSTSPCFARLRPAVVLSVGCQKSRVGERGVRVTQRGKSGEAASSDGEIHTARQEVRQRLTGESGIS